MRINLWKAAAGLLCLSATALADTHIKAKYTSDGRVTESATYMQGQRRRIEYGKDTIVLNQVDLQRMVKLNLKTKTYLVLPLEPEKPAETAASVVDTGERKQVFGLNARRLKTTIDDAKAARVETDGWYIDLETAPAYPVQYTMTGSGATVSMEVVELSTAALDASLFEIPAGYSPEAHLKKSNLREAPPKLANVTRIGMALHNSSGQKLAEGALDEPIAGAMRDLVTEVVLLEGSDIAAVAQQKECDYILYTDLVELKKSTVGKVGGLLSRASGGGSAKEAFDARLDYKLVRVGVAEPVLESSASGKSGGGFDLRGAARLATTAGSLAMSMTMYPRLFSMMSSSNGSAMPNLDPTMNSLSLLFRGTAAAKPETAKRGPADIAAVSAALEREGKAVMAELQKKKG